jgi:hypothetical protein
MFEDGRFHGGADDCVETGAIAAACGDRYSFDFTVSHCDCAIVANQNLMRMSVSSPAITWPYNCASLFGENF